MVQEVTLSVIRLAAALALATMSLTSAVGEEAQGTSIAPVQPPKSVADCQKMKWDDVPLDVRKTYRLLCIGFVKGLTLPGPGGGIPTLRVVPDVLPPNLARQPSATISGAGKS